MTKNSRSSKRKIPIQKLEQNNDEHKHTTIVRIRNKGRSRKLYGMPVANVATLFNSRRGTKNNIIGPRDSVVNLGLEKIKMEEDYIPPGAAFKTEPLENVDQNFTHVPENVDLDEGVLHPNVSTEPDVEEFNVIDDSSDSGVKIEPFDIIEQNLTDAPEDAEINEQNLTDVQQDGDSSLVQLIQEPEALNGNKVPSGSEATSDSGNVKNLNGVQEGVDLDSSSVLQHNTTPEEPALPNIKECECTPVESPPNEKIQLKKKRFHVPDHVSVVKGDQPLFQCRICTKMFKTKTHCGYHVFCLKNRDKPFKCEQCNRGFISKSHYEYHIRTHTGECPYVCPNPKCGKGFKQNGKLTRHMLTHTGEKPYVCQHQQCGKRFTVRQGLKAHSLVHTEERPFACTFCDKKFKTVTSRKVHIFKHTGERPFPCCQCGRKFVIKWSLVMHLRTHSSVRPYACQRCPRVFSQPRDLRKHIATHYGIWYFPQINKKYIEYK